MVLPLLVLLSLAARAQTSPVEAAPPASAPDAGSDRAKLLDEIEAWRSLQLPRTTPPDPLTAKYEPRLDRIADAARAAATAESLARPRADFEAWKRAILREKHARARGMGLTVGSLDQYARVERAQAALLADERAQAAQQRLVDSFAARRARAAGAVADPGLFFDGGDSNGAVPVSYAPGSRAGAAAPAPQKGFHAGAAPAPAAAPSASSWMDYFDFSRAKRLAADVYSRAIGFTHRCYEYVANAMEAAGLFSPASSDARARRRFAYYWPPVGGSSAYQFAALKDHPDVMKKTGIARLDPSTRPLPIGTVLVYGRGCMGFSPKHGHIEVVAKPSAGVGDSSSFYACSDGCASRAYGWMSRAVARSCVDAFIPVRAPRPVARAESSPTIGI